MIVVLSQVYVHLRCARHGEDGHGARGDALSAARGRRGRDPSVPLHRDQRDEDDGSSSGLRPDPAGERRTWAAPQTKPELRFSTRYSAHHQGELLSLNCSGLGLLQEYWRKGLEENCALRPRPFLRVEKGVGPVRKLCCQAPPLISFEKTFIWLVENNLFFFCQFKNREENTFAF